MLTDVSPDKRRGKLQGFTCVADFDLTPETLEPLLPAIRSALTAPEGDLRAGRCDTLNIGLYDGGKTIRVWRITSK